MTSMGKSSAPIDFGKIVVSAYHERGRDITENYDKWVGFSAKWGDVIKAWKAYC